MSKRDSRIDNLRALAIILIILAHITPPVLIRDLRTFDVPLMSMLLGMSFVKSISTKDINESYKSYIIKRFNRLIIPSWIFLTFLFSSILIISIIFRIPYPFNLKSIISSFALISGIGYVWIIRVFFTIAFVSPTLFVFSKKINNQLQQILIVYGLIVLQQFFYYTSKTLDGVNKLLFEQLIAISFAYTICALVGMWCVNYTGKQLIKMSISMLIPFFVIIYLNHFSSLQDEKYPPSAYFLFYGLMMSLILLYLLTVIPINSKIANWLSKYSLEVYYWHIFPVMGFQFLEISLNWGIKFILTTIITVILTKIQLKLFPDFFRVFSKNVFLNKFRRIAN